jgi:cell division GTPase FtsZ
MPFGIDVPAPPPLGIAVHGCGPFGQRVSAQIALSHVGDELVFVVCDEDDAASVAEARQAAATTGAERVLTMGFIRASSSVVGDNGAIAGRAELLPAVDSLIVVPGAPEVAAEQMVQAIRHMVHICTVTEQIGIDLADLRTLFGGGHGGIGAMAAVETAGPGRVAYAVRSALDALDFDQRRPTSVLFVVGYEEKLGIVEFKAALEQPEFAESNDLELIFGMARESLTPGAVRVTMIATS